MGLMGREIIQSRVWLDPNAPPPPKLNYKFTYPITIFDAVHRDMYDDESETLAEVLDRLDTELSAKQHVIPAKSADYLMTYAGISGSVGSIKMSQKIPVDSASQSHDRIPTEKAVGDLLLKLGLMTSEGEATGDLSVKLLWTSIVGRPEIYDGLGNDDEGIISQAALTKIITEIKNEISGMWDDIESSDFGTLMRAHLNDQSNPHGVTPEQIGAASKTALDIHTTNERNPHHVTPEQIGLGNVDNTSDEDKPLSRSTRAAIEELNTLIGSITGMVGGLRYVIDTTYNQAKGRLDITYNDGSVVGVSIVTDGLVDEISIDKDTKELIVTELGGNVKRVDISTLIARYIGVPGTNIVVEVSKDFEIKASIIPKSITTNDIADGSITNSVFADGTITGNKIKDLTITTINLANNSVTSEKIKNGTIKDKNIDTHSITGRSIFTSTIPDRILGIREAGSDAEWMQVVSDMIADGAVDNRSLGEKSVTSEKIADNTIATINIKNEAVTGEKIAEHSVTGDRLVENTVLSGTPRIEVSPGIDADDNQIPDTAWVRYLVDHSVIVANRIAPRSVGGEQLFSSPVKNVALIVKEVNGDAEWGKIGLGMIDEQAIASVNIKDFAVTDSKLADNAVTARAMGIASVTTPAIAEGAVTGEKIYASDVPNRALVVGPDGGHPSYSQITTEMIAKDAVDTENIRDGSVTPSKFARPDDDNTVLVFDLEKKDPTWTKIGTKFIENRAVTGEKLFTSSVSNMVLAVGDSNTPPRYMKVTAEMLDKNIMFDPGRIENGSILRQHLAPGIIDSEHLSENAVTSEHIAEGAVTARELFKPSAPSRVLGVGPHIGDTAEWMQVQTEMLEDCAVTPEKLFRAEQPFRVLAADAIGAPPKYMQLTQDFIEDGALGSEKFKHNLTLYGHPSIGMHPIDSSNDYTIASTGWVRKTVTELIKLHPSSGVTDLEHLPDHSITGNLLFTSKEANSVIGIDEENGTAKYLKVNTEMISNGAVTRDKLERDMEMLGSPSLEVRPSPKASDKEGMGELIPDCQWVLDRIKESLRDYHDKLSEEIGCLRDPDLDAPGMSVTARIDDIPDQTVLDILSGDRDPSPSVPFTYNGSSVNPISDETISGIVNGEIITVEDSDSLHIGGAIVEPLSKEKILAILNGDYDAEDIDDGYITALINGGSGGGCNCNCGSGGGFVREYVSPIDVKMLDLILKDQAVPETVERIELDGIQIDRITEERITQFIEGNPDPEAIYTAGTDIDGKLLNTIDKSRIRGLIEGYIYPVPSSSIEVTDGINDMIKDDFGEKNDYKFIMSIEDQIITKIIEGTAIPQYRQPLYSDNGDLIEFIRADTISEMVDNRDAVTDPSVQFEVKGHQFAPIDVDRIRGIIMGDIEPASVDPVDISDEKYVPESAPLTVNSVITEYIQDRAVTGQKLFTSKDPNRVLVVKEANSDPTWSLISRAMLEDHIITPDLMFTSDTPNRLLGVRNAGDDPTWMTVNNGMLDDLIVDNRVIADGAVTGEKIMDFSVTASKLAVEPMINTVHLLDRAVTTRKIHNNAIIEEKIADGAISDVKIKRRTIQGDKLAPAIQIPAYASVAEHSDLERRALRNTIISPKLPTGGKNGDIWLQYS